MKVTQNHLRIAILCMGGLLILYGAVKLIWNVNFGAWIEANLPNGIFLGAAAIFVWNRSIYNKEQKAKKEAEEAKQKELEANAAEVAPAEASATATPVVEEPKKD